MDNQEVPEQDIQFERLMLAALTMLPHFEAKPKDCNNCLYKAIADEQDEGHCYMFREEPVGQLCGAFRHKNN